MPALELELELPSYEPTLLTLIPSSILAVAAADAHARDLLTWPLTRISS